MQSRRWSGGLGSEILGVLILLLVVWMLTCWKKRSSSSITMSNLGV